MEDLNKNQIILLALFVSFVASVATSIMTYSLLSEAPPTVTQTVNRVVERTVETVVPQQVRQDVITREVTVVVQEEDLVIDAIAKNEASLIKIWQRISNENRIFSGLGIILDKEGGVIIGAKVNPSNSPNFEAVLSNGSVVNLNYQKDSGEFSYFRAELPKDSIAKTATLGNSDNLQLGQTLISLRGEDKNHVSIGRLVSLAPAEDVKLSKFSAFNVDIDLNSFGSPAINLKGEIVGMAFGETNSFIPINLIKNTAAN